PTPALAGSARGNQASGPRALPPATQRPGPDRSQTSGRTQTPPGRHRPPPPKPARHPGGPAPHHWQPLSAPPTPAPPPPTRHPPSPRHPPTTEGAHHQQRRRCASARIQALIAVGIRRLADPFPGLRVIILPLAIGEQQCPEHERVPDPAVMQILR